MYKNPFPETDRDRHEIWDMLVRRDIEAFAANDWPSHRSDFLGDDFFAMDAGHSDNPDSWDSAFSDLDTYSENWSGFASASLGRLSADEMKAAHHSATTLRDIDINGDFAAAHKKFDGKVTYSDGSQDILKWQTLYFCKKRQGRWWISGFLGFLPNPMGNNSVTQTNRPISVPQSKQHRTAGPYSPVLEVTPGKIVVISGQAPVDMDGNVVSQDFAEQTRFTLSNCLTQLKAAGCGFADVFKANVYLTDLHDWPAFNAIYRETMPEPYPVRTAVQTPLLSTFQVEIELWAVKS